MVYKLYYGMDTILKIIFRQDLQDLQDIFFLFRFPEETGKILSSVFIKIRIHSYIF